MQQTRKRRFLIAFCSLLFACIMGIAVAQVIPAKAAEVSVTVQTDGNGTVSYGGSTSEKEASSSITVKANSGDSVTLTASADEGYVFAYWYTVENTPLSYEASYSYTMPAETTTVHAKFFKNEDGKVTTTAEGWTTDAGAGTYTIKSADGAYNFVDSQKFSMIFEFVGEKWFTYSYNLSLETTANARGSQTVYLDGLKYGGINHTTNILNNVEVVFKACKDKYHRVEIEFCAPYYDSYGYTPAPTAVEFSIGKIAIKDESQYSVTQATVNWDAYLGEAYYLPGVIDTSCTDAEYIIKNGIQIENKDGSAMVSVPANLPIGFAVKPFDNVTSTIDPSQQAGVHLGGIDYGPRAATSGDEAIIYVNEQGQVGTPGYFSVSPITMKLQEIAVLPKVSLTKTVGGNQETFEPASGSNYLLDYATANNLVFAISQSPEEKEVSGEEFDITVNGKPLAAKEDTGEGASDKGYTFLDGKYGFNLANLTENTVVVITPNYGEEYVKTSYTISFNISSPHSGLSDVISPASAPITIEDDSANPWFFDPAYNGEGNMYAFSSPYTGKETPSYSVSQIAFKVKGTGVFQLEFYLDGPLGYSTVGYKVGSKITPSSGDTFKFADIKNKTGFVAGVANNLAIPQTNIDYSGNQTYAAPSIIDTQKVKTLEGQEKWYTFTLGVNGDGEEETVIWFAHGIYNKYNSQYNRLTIRNVAYFSGTAYVDWGVEDADGQIVKNDGKIISNSGKAGILDAGTAINFTAKPDTGETFYGWKVISGTLTNPEKVGHEKEESFTVEDGDIAWDTENAKLVSYEISYRHVVGPGYNKVVAVMATSGTYAVRYGNKFYKPGEIQTAFSDATKGTDKNVVVVDTVTLSAITVPANVNLVIPFNRAGDFYTMGTKTTAQTRVSWASGDAKYEKPVYTLTLTGTNTINGTLDVGGVLHYPEQVAQGLTSGYYSQLILSGAETKVTVGKGGHLDIYGRVTGEGSIDVQSGGKLTQPFMITDYNGGTNTQASFNAGVTPFKMYAMVNVQNKGGFTIHHGAELWGHASLYFWESITTIDAPFISYVKETKEGMDYFQNDALIVLRQNASAHIVYDDEHERVKFIKEDEKNNLQDVGKTTITLTGGAYADFMQFPLNINTTQVYFSVPYNFDITLKSGGTFDILHPYKMMPGSSFTVEEDATLTVRTPSKGQPNGLHVYDSFYGPDVNKRKYPTGAELKTAGYQPYASLIVNGTLNIQDGATFLGTVQTTGTKGKIVVGQNVKLTDDTLFDGVSTQYSCNYTKYTLTAQVYDAAHKCMGKLEAGKTYTSVAASGGWTLPGIAFQYETKTDAGAHGDAHTLDNLTTDGVTLTTGSWKVQHDKDNFDWSQLLEGENDFAGKKFKELTRQCTELGCDKKEHKLLLNASAITLSAVYKGAEFNQDEVLKIFYQAVFGSDAVPEEYSSYFSASANLTAALQNANTYVGNVQISLEGGLFDTVGTTEHTYDFTIEKFNVEKLDKGAIEKALTEKNFTYNGEAQKLDDKELEAVLKAEGLTGTVSHAAFVWANNTNAGTNTASVTITGSGTNFEGTLTVNFSIAKAKITIKVTDKEKDYDGQAYTDIESADEGDYTVTVGQIYKPNGVADFTVKLTVQEAAKDAASYTVTAAAVGAGAENYEISYEQGTYTIHQKALTVTIGEVEQVYGGTLSALTFTLAGDVSGETESIKQAISLSTEAVAWSNVGTYKITATYKAGEGILKNYTVTVSNENNKAYSVTAKEIGEATFTVTPSYTYDGKKKQPVVSEITVTLDGYTDDHAVTFTVESYQDNTNAGTASLTVKGTNNFAGTKTVNFEIAKRSIEGATIEKINDVEYNGKAQQLKPSTVTVAIDGGTLTLRETTDYTVSWTADCTNVGTVTVTLKAAENGNYEGTATATYSINQKKLTITADDQTTPEGEAVLSGKALTWKVTDGQFYNQDETEIGTHIEVSTEADSKKAGTDFEIKIGWKSDYSCKNYDVTFKNGTYHIVDAIFKNVAISGQTVKYNGEKHNLTVTIPNEDIQQIATIKITKNGEDFDGATDAGVYSLHVNITAQGYSTKYDLDVTLTIEKIAVTVTFDPQSSTYGDDVVTEFTYTMPAGVLEKDRETVKAAITPRTDATKKSGVGGSYKITAEKPVLANYDVTIEDGVYTIEARPVTVTVKKQTVTFNQAQQSASSTYETDWTVDNLAEGDEASVLKIKLTAAGKDAKAYDIAASYENTNYAVTFKGEGGLTVQGSTVKEAFVIEAAALTGATLTSSHTYDGSEQTPTFTVKAGALTVAEGDFELAYDGADRVSAGTVQVTVKATSGNYSGEVKTNFEIAKKQIKVTLTAQTAEYSGKVPTLNQKAYTVEDGGLCSRNGKEDDLQITITLVNGQKDVGDYNLDAEAGNTDYEVTFDKSAKFKVTQKAITVKADDLTSVYGEKVKELTYTANGLVEGEDPKTELKITLQASSTIKEEGSYAITGSGSAKNYTFTVAGGTYTVSPKPIRVQIVSRSSVYDGKEPTVTSVRGTDWTVAEDAIEQGDDLQIVLTKALGVDVKQGGYAITGKYTNHNYTVTFVDGTYTITARPVTVKIADQEAVYDYAHKYAFNNDAWTYEGTLAGSETRADLKITLSTETLTDAGSYKITGTCANGNYAVTFTGSYTKQEDAASGHAGVYTVKQKDVGDGTEDAAVFLLVVGEGGNTSEGERKLRVKLTGESLNVTCTVKVYEGTDEKTLNCKIDPAELKTLGEQTVTVTIEDQNYKGSAVFTVVVTDAEGFTPELKAKLEQLKTLAAGMDAEALKAEDFPKLKEINAVLTALSEEEREALGESLEPYDELVAAWHELADLDEIIETAEAIGNAPIRGLYEAAAAVSALAVLGYIVMKGGLL